MTNLIIPTNGQPTPASRDAWNGVGVGNMTALMAVSLFELSPVPALAMMAGGMGIGYVWGHARGERNAARELQTGAREVKSPSFFNHTLVKGWIMGSAVSMGLAAMAHVIPVPQALRGFIVIGSAIAGSIAGRASMSREYDEAQAKLVQHWKGARAAAQTPEQGVESPSLSAGIAAPEAARQSFTQAEQARQAQVDKQVAAR